MTPESGFRERQMMRQSNVVHTLVICCVLVAGFCFYLEAIRPYLLFSQERETIGQLLRQWSEDPPPPGITKIQWEYAWGIAHIGFGNVCFSPNYVSLAEMHRLKADLQEKMRQPATIASLRWFWNRLAETGPQGHEYIQRMRPLLDEAIGELAAVGA